MRWTSQASACLVAVALVGCNGARNNRTDGTAGSGAETGSMSDTAGMPGGSGTGGMSADTGRSGMTGSDTSRSGMSTSDTGQGGSMRQSGTTGSGMSSDTGSGGARMGSDSAKGNQTKSGVTDTKTGKSTLGPGVTKTRPDQGQPVTSKGDTINQGMDSTQR